VRTVSVSDSGDFFEKNFRGLRKNKKNPVEIILSDISGKVITTSLADVIPKQAFLSFPRAIPCSKKPPQQNPAKFAGQNLF
jgi:hypothetical protein